MNRRAGKPTTKKMTQLVNVEEHVEGFRQVREAHRRELIDDYVELISDLIREVGEARQVDMAARLGVSQPTVAKMLKRLATVGLIEMIPWRGVFSPRKGRSWRRRAASAIKLSKISCWYWASVLTSPAVTPKGWSITLAKRPCNSSWLLPLNMDRPRNDRAWPAGAGPGSFLSSVTGGWGRAQFPGALRT